MDVLRVVLVYDKAVEEEELDRNVDAVVEDEQHHHEVPPLLEGGGRRQDAVVLPQVARDHDVDVRVVELRLLAAPRSTSRAWRTLLLRRTPFYSGEAAVFFERLEVG